MQHLNLDLILNRTEKLIKELGKDASLSAFGQFFVRCMIVGNAENVNLKKEYPATYAKIHAWLKEHEAIILAAQKKKSSY